ncbi:hypothetical protein H0H92_002999, partial [Tricholoma furcatifolium]
HVEELVQRIEIRRGKAGQPDSSTRNSPAPRIDEPEQDEARKRVDDAAWAAPNAKLAAAKGDTRKAPVPRIAIDIDSEEEQPEENTVPTISKAVLAIAPHLGQLS